MRGDGSLYLRGRTYWTCVYINGQPNRESTGTADKESAVKVLRARMKKVHASEVTGEVFESASMKKYTVGEALDGLLDRWTLDGKATKKNLSHLKQTREAFGSYRVAQLDAAAVDAFAKDWLANGYARSTVNRWLLILKRALTMAVNGKRIARVPFFEYLSDADNVRTDCFADEAELDAVINNLPADLQDYTRWCAAIGMRKSEAAALTWTMRVEESDGWILRIPKHICKNKKDRELPIIGELGEILERRKLARTFDRDGVKHVSQFIFHRDGRQIADFFKSWRTATRKAGCPGRLFHSTRRFAATAMLEAGLAPSVAMKWTGHETQSMLERYQLIKKKVLADDFGKLEAYRTVAKSKAKSRKIISIGR
jgi:integrase